MRDLESAPLLSQAPFPLTPDNQRFLLNTHKLVGTDNLTYETLLKKVKLATQHSSRYKAVRLVFWTTEGLTCAYIFFGATEENLAKSLQTIGAPLGDADKASARKFVTAGTVFTNGPFNAVVSLDTIQLVQEDVVLFRQSKEWKTILTNTGIVAFQLLGTAIGSLSFYAQIHGAPLGTMLGSALQIVPNNAAGTAGISNFLRSLSEIISYQKAVFKGTLSEKEHYARYLPRLIKNTSKRKQLIELIRAFQNGRFAATNNYQAQALTILFKRIMNTAETHTSLKSKIWHLFFPSVPHAPVYEKLSDIEKNVLACFIIDLTEGEKRPFSPETNLVFNVGLNFLQFWALWGVMYLGNEALIDLFGTPAIGKLYAPYIVLDGMLLAFGQGVFDNLPSLLHNPVFTLNNFKHNVMFSMFFTVFLSMLSVSWSGASAAILDAMLNKGLDASFFSHYAWFVINACSTTFSNGLASLRLMLSLYCMVAASIGDNDITEAVIADDVVNQCAGAVSEILEDDEAFDQIKEAKLNISDIPKAGFARFSREETNSEYERLPDVPARRLSLSSSLT